MSVCSVGYPAGWHALPAPDVKIALSQAHPASQACVASPYRVGRQHGECPSRTPGPGQAVGRTCLVFSELFLLPVLEPLVDNRSNRPGSPKTHSISQVTGVGPADKIKSNRTLPLEKTGLNNQGCDPWNDASF